jgi:hypothetical protein
VKRNGPGLVVALVVVLAALAGPPAASAAVELEISAPKGSDVLVEELKLKAKCDEACTIALNRVQVQNVKGMTQLPGSTEEPLKGSKKLKPGKPVIFNVPLGPGLRSQIQSAAANKEAALVQVVTNYNGEEGPYRSATVRTKKAPKSPLGQDDIVVAPKPKLKPGAPRFRVTVKGVQTTTWHYNRNYVDGDCHSWARGDGKQTIAFTSTKPVVVRYGSRVRPGKKKAEPELVGKDGDFEWYPLRFDITRTGERDHGGSPECAGGGGGHCPECEGPNPQPEQCTTKGTRARFDLALMLSETHQLWTVPGVGNRTALAPGQMPDCPIETFKSAWGDVDLLFAKHKFGNPTTHGGGRKVIVILRNKVTDPLDEGAGFTTTTVRYTVTFNRL